MVIIFLMAQRAKASVTGGSFDFKLQQLAEAISIIEGGTPENPGNIRDHSGAIGVSGDLNGLLRRAFVTQDSKYYRADMTFTEFAWMYVSGTTPGNWSKVIKTDNPDKWAAFVAGHLGVSVDTTVWEFLNS